MPDKPSKGWKEEAMSVFDLLEEEETTIKLNESCLHPLFYRRVWLHLIWSSIYHVD